MTGQTRSGTAFKPVSTCNMAGADGAGEDELDSSLHIYKVPKQLQWLVVEESNEFCWIFYSRSQQKLKCRVGHPNIPGI